ncbi:MAG: hypothetical protein J0I88_05060 [Chryseobacterium sp.]|nr:hypothetical protein [Chryseobacterium sp.]
MKITNWEEYWKNYDLLISKIEKGNLYKIAIDLRTAKSYVNGLTDGWYDFSEAFESIINNNKNSFSNEEIEVITLLLKHLKNGTKKSLNKILKFNPQPDLSGSPFYAT